LNIDSVATAFRTLTPIGETGIQVSLLCRSGNHPGRGLQHLLTAIGIVAATALRLYR
jgi:hypothetical protein